MNASRILLATIVFGAAILLLLSSSGPLSASPAPPDPISAYRVDFPPMDDPPPPSEDAEIVMNPGETGIIIMGTMWQPQRRKMFKEWPIVGWGTIAQLKPAKAPSDEWVHISPSEVHFLNGKAQKIKQVWVCAAASNPTVSRPFRIDLWSWNNDRFYSSNIAWPNTTGRHCAQVVFGTPIFKYGVSVSLFVHFANGTDQVTLQEVYINLID